MFLVNSRLGHFSAAPASSPSKLNHRPEHPLSRSYGVNLPSSLTRVISSTLGYSPHLPVSVCGTDDCKTHIEAFLGSMIRASWLTRRLVSPSPLGGSGGPDLPGPPSYRLRPAYHKQAGLSLLRHPIAQTHCSRYRNINLFSIAYVFRPRLRFRLTLSGLTFLRKP